jgi:2-keto-3-deoxy-L-fuconate dehydrogenase
MAADHLADRVRVNCVTPATVDLAGPTAGATTGTALAVDGGMQGLRMPANPGGR